MIIRIIPNLGTSSTGGGVENRQKLGILFPGGIDKTRKNWIIKTL